MIAYFLPMGVKFLKSIPIHAKGFRRKLKLQFLKKIKSKRFDDTKIILEVIKTSGLFVVFLLLYFMLLYNFISQPFFLTKLANPDIARSVILFVMSLPIYIVEVIYVTQREFFEELVKSRDKLGIK